jgi:hypothetical protein
MIADQENPNLKISPDRSLDLNPRKSAFIRGKNPWLFSGLRVSVVDFDFF